MAEPELQEVEEITQALDYIADHTFSEEQIKILTDCLIPINPAMDLDLIIDDFPGKRGIITRLRAILQFVEKYQSNQELISELQSEMAYLIAGIQGQTGGQITL